MGIKTTSPIWKVAFLALWDSGSGKTWGMQRTIYLKYLLCHWCQKGLMFISYSVQSNPWGSNFWGSSPIFKPQPLVGKLRDWPQVSLKGHLPPYASSGVPGFPMCQKQSSASSPFISHQALTLQGEKQRESRNRLFSLKHRNNLKSIYTSQCDTPFRSLMTSENAWSPSPLKRTCLTARKTKHVIP